MNSIILKLKLLFRKYILNDDDISTLLTLIAYKFPEEAYVQFEIDGEDDLIEIKITTIKDPYEATVNVLYDELLTAKEHIKLLLTR